MAGKKKGQKRVVAVHAERRPLERIIHDLFPCTLLKQKPRPGVTYANVCNKNKEESIILKHKLLKFSTVKMNAPENNSGRFARQNDIRLCVLFYHIKGKMSRKNRLLAQAEFPNYS